MASIQMQPRATPPVWAEVRALAHELFGTEPAVDHWMNRANPEFGGQTPSDLLRAGKGDVVKDYLTASLAGDYN